MIDIPGISYHGQEKPKVKQRNEKAKQKAKDEILIPAFFCFLLFSALAPFVLLLGLDLHILIIFLIGVFVGMMD